MELKTICISCGRQLKGKKRFCPYCGAEQTVDGSMSRSSIYDDSEGSYYGSSGPSLEESVSWTGGSYNRSKESVAGRNQYRGPGTGSGHDRLPPPPPGYGSDGRPLHAGRPTYTYGGPEPDPPDKGKGERIFFAVLITLLCLAIIAVSTVVVVRIMKHSDEEVAEADDKTAAAGKTASDGGEKEEEEETETASTDKQWEETTVTSEEEGTGSQADNPPEQLPDVPTGAEPSYIILKYADSDGANLYVESIGDERVKTDNKYKSEVVPEAVIVAKLGEENGRTRIYYAGFSGWVDNSDIEFFSDEAYYLYDDDLSETIYQAYDLKNNKGIIPHSKPSADEKTKLDEKYRIPYGKEFIVKEINKGFARIKYKKKDCWVDMHYFRSYAGHAKQWIVDNQSKDYVRLRGEKNLDSKKKLAKIWNGTYITVSEIDHGWGKVSYDGKTGWVDLKSCKPMADD